MILKSANTILLTVIFIFILSCSVYGKNAGDLNCDGSVNSGDCSAFILAMTDPAQYAQVYPNCFIMNADMNGDTFIDCNDWTLFQQALGQPLPPCADVPCPLGETSIPTMTEMGMIIFVVFAGLGAVYCMRRQKRTNN